MSHVGPTDALAEPCRHHSYIRNVPDLPPALARCTDARCRQVFLYLDLTQACSDARYVGDPVDGSDYPTTRWVFDAGTVAWLSGQPRPVVQFDGHASIPLTTVAEIDTLMAALAAARARLAWPERVTDPTRSEPGRGRRR